MATSNTFPTIQASILKSLVSVTRSTNELCKEDLGFHRVNDSSVGQLIDAQNERLLQLVQRLLDAATGGQERLIGPQLADVEAIDGNWGEVVDVVDNLLERADTTLDEFGGYVRRSQADETAAAAQLSATRPAMGSWNATRTHHDITKPQKSFEHPPNNFENGPWKPLLTKKPHALNSLEQVLKPVKDDDGMEHYPHPYEAEITAYEYPKSTYQSAEPSPYSPFDETTATLVDTPEALEEMLAELRQASEIAIDLEHHDNRTYIGLVSLMQISTRNKDWIVDTLKPWRRRLECLNEVFADPKILKVLHGSFMDVIWLQRDLGLYLVGLFDTHYASKALRYPGGSLAFLLQKFVNFTAQKQYQMADWRQRPLPPQLFDYARADTHFLLYVYDCLRNDLAEQSKVQGEDLVKSVLENSRETALHRYENPNYDYATGQGAGWYRQIFKTPAMLSREQFNVFRAVHQWRDRVAREEDESVFFVIKNHSLLEIARSLPDNKPSLFALIAQPSSIIRQRIDELLGVVRRAKEEGANAPDMNEVLAEADKVYEQAQVRKRSKRYSPPPQQAAQSAVQAPAAEGSTGSPSPIQLRKYTTGPATAPSAKSSALWGGITSYWNGSKSSLSTQAVQLSLPMPEMAADPIHLESGSVAVDSPPAVIEDAVPQTKADDVFVMRQAGGVKRKRDDIRAEPESPSVRQALPLDNQNGNANGSESNSANEDGEVEDAYNDSVSSGQPLSATARKDPTKAELKSQRKAAKKAKKRAEKAALLNGQDSSTIDAATNVLDENEEPFDYAAAGSVLHPTHPVIPSKNKKAPMNPFKRAMDAPKGLPKAQKPGAGRSATFMN